MSNYRSQFFAGLALVTAALVAQAGGFDESHFLSTPVGAAVKQGIDASGSCVLDLAKIAEDAACVIATQQRNAKKGGATDPYDLGLYFDAWYTMDMLAHPDEPMTVDIQKQAAAAAKPEAVRFFKLYRALQKKVHVTDEQLIVLYLLNKPELLKARIGAAARDTGA